MPYIWWIVREHVDTLICISLSQSGRQILLSDASAVSADCFNESSPPTLAIYWALYSRSGASILGPQYFDKGSRHQSQAPPIIKLQNVHPCQPVIKIMKCLYYLNCPKFGQLIYQEMLRIIATRCQILGVKMYTIRFQLGLRPRPHTGSLQQRSSAGRAYSAPPDPLAAFKGPYF